MKYLIAMGLLGVMASLGAALLFMMRRGPSDSEPPRNRRVMRALALRVAVSVVLFICLLLAWKLGYIRPTGLPAGA